MTYDWREHHDRERFDFDARLERVLEAERNATIAKAEREIVENAVHLRDLLPDDVVIVPPDTDLANHSGFEEMPE